MTVRKSRHGVRPVAEFYIRDQLLYRALVMAWGNSLPTPIRTQEAFDAFEASPLEDETASYVISSDIVAFYQYIDYDLLSREILARTGDAVGVDVLLELLTGTSGQRFGIPQQNRVSDVLADAYGDEPGRG